MQDRNSLWFAWPNLAAGPRVARFLAVTLCMGLAACAADRNYPSLSTITDLVAFSLHKSVKRLWKNCRSRIRLTAISRGPLTNNNQGVIQPQGTPWTLAGSALTL